MPLCASQQKLRDDVADGSESVLGRCPPHDRFDFEADLAGSRRDVSEVAHNARGDSDRIGSDNEDYRMQLFGTRGGYLGQSR
jgi:hypothetical protein